MTTEEVPDSWRRSFTTKEERAVALLMDLECCLKSLASGESSNHSSGGDVDPAVYLDLDNTVLTTDAVPLLLS